MTRETAKNPAAPVCLLWRIAFTEPNGNELRKRRANLNSEGQLSIVGYKFVYSHQFGLITDN